MTDFFSITLIVVGLTLFETISSIDNAIINAQVLGTMGTKGRKWFLTWGMFISVFLVRGLLPWIIVWAALPALGPLGAFTATFSNNPAVIDALQRAAPVLLLGGGTFLVFLFFHWLFLEQKEFGLRAEKFFYTQGVWFFAVVSLLLVIIVWFALQKDPMMAFGAVIGSSAFFIVHGFKESAEKQEQKLISGHHMSDISKLMYLEIIDATFSIDGVLGAFAFTLAVPLILIGNGIGALVVRELTIRNIERLKKYRLLKNGAMYSVVFLGLIMLLEGFHFDVPAWIAPITTFFIVGYFYYRSRQEITHNTV